MSWIGWYVDASGFWQSRLNPGDMPKHGHWETGKEFQPLTGMTIETRKFVRSEEDAPAAKTKDTAGSGSGSGSSGSSTTAGSSSRNQTPADRRREWYNREQRRIDHQQKRVRKLRRAKRRAVNRLELLRWRYRRARADQHILRKNLVRRMRQTEDRIEDLNREIRHATRVRDRNSARVHLPQQPKFEGQITVEMLLSTDGVTFQPDVPVRMDARVWAMARITLNQRSWKPGMLASPWMMRLKWNPPDRYRKQDDLPMDHDEYVVSNPLVIIREFKAPRSKPTGGQWSVAAELYEIVLDGSVWDANSHLEGTQ